MEMLKHPLRLLLLLAVVIAMVAPSLAAPVKKEEVDYQNQNFKTWWETDLSWKHADLPTQGVVPKYRVPYSGHDYPDRAGGTMTAMKKYDAAFNRGGSGSAADYEHEDLTNHGKGIFKGSIRPGSIWARARMRRAPHWYGHCNGWTSASIRHAEPQKSVTRNGVTFSPADIKGMLAEVYMYNDNEFCGGVDDAINPATLHVIISNWLGRGTHPVGMDSTLGKEVWNYPIYSYATKAKKIGDNKLDVWMTVAYAASTRQEMDQSPRIRQEKYFHYSLDLNDQGEITGGEYFGDSDRLDMLWTPLKPSQGGKPGNELGNPHLDVKEVLAIWRESVPAKIRNKWTNIDPTEEDQIELKIDENVADADQPLATPPTEDDASKEAVAEETTVDETDADETAKADSDDAPRTAAAEGDTATETE
jgi:hypothetical protein